MLDSFRNERVRSIDDCRRLFENVRDEAREALERDGLYPHGDCPHALFALLPDGSVGACDLEGLWAALEEKRGDRIAPDLGAFLFMGLDLWIARAVGYLHVERLQAPTGNLENPLDRIELVRFSGRYLDRRLVFVWEVTRTEERVWLSECVAATLEPYVAGRNAGSPEGFLDTAVDHNLRHRVDHDAA